MSEYAYQAKIADLHSHDLRHRFAYRLKETEIPTEVIARQLGHERLDTTMLYGKPPAADEQREVEKVGWK